ncbi:uncharacterized protein N0V89_008959 [Didymosphaeria variabile]|uniref:Infection structure specific protein n=1 Tax=Didymosphaeria variabile TaxID=1932322 RepID=A0A9W8XHF6_9PLEO|nr:uncharacterized protein N0V89_008959 [Didymosphaeria variabile]KAJ4350338.1 hypothetical protein N0V89_008959 [Didymosphaeria variabile]
MTKSLLSVALLTTVALAAPRPDVEVVQVRQVEKRQESSVDLSDLIPTSIDLGDLASLIPTDLASAIPTDLDLSSLIGDVATLIPSGCLPPSDLATPPTPPADVESAILSYTDVCHEPSFTGDVGKHYTSYLSAASAWAESNGPVFSSWYSDFQTACPYASAVPTDAGDISSLLASYSVTLPSCGSATASSAKQTGSASGNATAKTSGTGSSTGSSESAASSSESGSAQSANNTGAAPQQTAFAAVAGVVAGFAGVVAYL